MGKTSCSIGLIIAQLDDGDTGEGRLREAFWETENLLEVRGGAGKDLSANVGCWAEGMWQAWKSLTMTGTGARPSPWSGLLRRINDHLVEFDREAIEKLAEDWR